MTVLEQIQQKAEQSKLQTKVTKRTITIFEPHEERIELFIQIPFERDFKTVSVDQKNIDIERILNSGFEKYKLLKGYEAIYSEELGIVECELQTDEDLRTTGFFIRRLSKFFTTQNKGESQIRETNSIDEESEVYNFEFPAPDESLKITIGYSSDAFSFLSGNRREAALFLRRRLRKIPTIKISGLKIQQHNQAKELLSSIGNSIFFQIDLITNIPIHLASDRDLQREIRIRKKATKKDFNFSTPKFQYDLEPISLYWYARTATNMPLLQFLSFYQVLEFYFPQYSALEAQQKIKNLLKDPTFDRHNDKNIARILDIVKVHGKEKSWGDERSQIRATIQSCVDESDLKEFLDEFKERRDFFDDQLKGKSLVKQKISFNRKDHDLRFDVSNRIYELRCRIVHTKDNSDIELLLPFSLDLAYIKYDIELVEFLARKVLISSGKPIDLKI